MDYASEWHWGITTSNKLNIRKAPALSAPRWNNVWPLGRIALIKPVAHTSDWYETTYRGEPAYVSAAFITLLSDAVPSDFRARIERIGAAEIGRKGSVYFNGYNGMWCHRFADWLVMHAGMDSAAVPNTSNCRAGILWFATNPIRGGFYFKNPVHKARMTARCHSINALGKHLSQEEEEYMPETGDYIYFRWPNAPDSVNVSHVGIVRSASNGKVTTFEGNAGNKVISREIEQTDTRIVGYGRPCYSLCA